MADEEKPIKVSDFRMFTPDGELKPEYRDLESAVEEPPAPAPPEPPKSEPRASAPAEEPPPLPGGAEPDFVDLVRSLATSAYAALGLLAEPGVPPGARDLPGARRLIDWISLLERKTRGNLSFAEQDLLTRALYELRMAYVEASGAPAPPSAR